MDLKMQKIEAIKTLLEFSLLFSNQVKVEIVNNLNRFTESEIESIGKLLAIEHENRSSLDEATIKSYIENFSKTYGKKQ
jgi:hypothetical protein